MQITNKAKKAPSYNAASPLVTAQQRVGPDIRYTVTCEHPNRHVSRVLNGITASESVTYLGLDGLRRSTQPKGKLSLTDNNLEPQEVESLHTVCLPPNHLGTTH